jgi:hypothetical protein
MIRGVERTDSESGVEAGLVRVYIAQLRRESETLPKNPVTPQAKLIDGICLIAGGCAAGGEESIAV